MLVRWLVALQADVERPGDVGLGALQLLLGNAVAVNLLHHALEFAERLAFLLGRAADVERQVAGIDRIGVETGHRVGQAALVPQFHEQAPAHAAENGVEHVQRVAVRVAARDGGKAPR